LQPLEKVEVKERPAEFAVGNALQPDRFLFLDDFPDGVVFDRAQLVFRNFVSLKARACILETLGPEQAADVVGAERRVQP
jgi:hypothetical protein